MDRNKFKQLMEGYLKGDLSAEDLELLQRWYDSFGESEAKVPGLEDEQTAQELRDELNTRLWKAISPPETIEIPAGKRIIWRRIVAAAVVIITLGGTLWYAMEQQYASKEAGMAASQQVFLEVETGVRQVKKLTLPDGSVIHVNANSTIRVPEVMGGNERTVFLDEGEAYFEVARDTLMPFTVQTGTGLRIEVLGTAFNVRSYGTLEDVTVAVSHGKVRVSNTEHLLGDLVANEGITYHKTEGLASITYFDTSVAYGWMTGTVQLEKAGFNELALTLYNLYGVRLRSDDPRTTHFRYNLSLRSDRTLEETMEVICGIHKNSYRRTDDEIILYP